MAGHGLAAFDGMIAAPHQRVGVGVEGALAAEDGGKDPSKVTGDKEELTLMATAIDLILLLVTLGFQALDSSADQSNPEL